MNLQVFSQPPQLAKMELGFLEGISFKINDIENAITLCYRSHKDYRIFIQKLAVDLNLNSQSLAPYEILFSQINGVEMAPSTFSFISDSLSILIYESANQGSSLILWEKDAVDSTTSFFDSFQDKETGKWKVKNQYDFSTNVTCVRKRDLSVWIGLANGDVFELQVKPWNIQQRDLQSFPFLDFSHLIKELNLDTETRNLEMEKNANTQKCSGPVEFLIESPNELVVLSAHHEAHGMKFSMNHFLGETVGEGWLYITHS